MFAIIANVGMQLPLLAQSTQGTPPNAKIGFIVALLPVLGLLIIAVSAIYLMFRRMRRRAILMGYPTRMVYLRAVPRNEAERCDAVDMATKGAILCILGVLFPPLILFGSIPLYYGSRKLILIGLGSKATNVEDHDGKPV